MNGLSEDKCTVAIGSILLGINERSHLCRTKQEHCAAHRVTYLRYSSAEAKLNACQFITEQRTAKVILNGQQLQGKCSKRDVMTTQIIRWRKENNAVDALY